MRTALALLVAGVWLLAGCGKKEWPKPLAQEEQVFVDSVAARQEGGCLLVAVKVGGNLANVEFFRVELEAGGCPTCPFQATAVRQVSPFDANVRREQNSYLIRLCGVDLPGPLRLRLGVDNTFATLPPALSAVIPVEPDQGGAP